MHLPVEPIKPPVRVLLVEAIVAGLELLKCDLLVEKLVQQWEETFVPHLIALLVPLTVTRLRSITLQEGFE
jgi:hypothetical protein